MRESVACIQCLWCFFFSSRRRHTRCSRDWSSDVCSSDLTKEKEMPYFGQEIFIQAQAKGPLTDQDYLRALDKNHLLARTQGIDTVMADHQLDALIAPTGGPAALIDLVNGDPGGGDRKSVV